MAETPSRLSLLTWHFFRRFLDNDLISPSGDAHVGISQALAALVAPSLLLTAVALLKYTLLWRPTWQHVQELSASDALLFVSLSMIVLGMAATVTWDAFFLEPRDYVILTVLPVPVRLLTAAKLGALGLFLVALVGAGNLVPTVLMPISMLQGVASATFLGHFVPLTIAQALAPGLAGAWAVLAVVALRGIVGLVLPERGAQRAGQVLQGCLVLGFLVWFVSLSPFVDHSVEALTTGGALRDASPPMWFLGVYESIIGHPAPACRPLARTALASFAALVAVVAAIHLVPARRPPMPSPSSSSRSLLSRVRSAATLILVRQPVKRACFGFTLATLARSAKHRMYLTMAAGAGLAWAATGVFWEYARAGAAALRAPSTPVLEVQQILVLVTICAVRFGALVPAALPANWLFRLTEGRPTRRYHSATRRAALTVGLVPVAGLVPLHLAIWGWPRAAYHAGVGFCFAWFMVELLFSGFEKVPFTAAYVSGQLKLKSRLGHYVLAAVGLAALPSALEAAALRGSIEHLAPPALIVSMALVLAAFRWRREHGLQGLVFDDTPDDALQTLRLNE